MKAVAACRGADGPGNGRASGDTMLTKSKLALMMRLMKRKGRERLGGELGRAVRALKRQKSV